MLYQSIFARADIQLCSRLTFNSFGKFEAIAALPLISTDIRQSNIVQNVAFGYSNRETDMKSVGLNGKRRRYEYEARRIFSTRNAVSQVQA